MDIGTRGFELIEKLAVAVAVARDFWKLTVLRIRVTLHDRLRYPCRALIFFILVLPQVFVRISMAPPFFL